MNQFTFEFTSDYLAKIGFESMTNKYYEICSPMTDIDRATNKKKPIENIELLSIFQIKIDKKDKLYFNSMYVKPEPGKNRKIEFDPTKITLWKEYFCRFDEGRKDKKEFTP
jgi:hypothetical protein